jgi:hypothetical protein
MSGHGLGTNLLQGAAMGALWGGISATLRGASVSEASADLPDAEPSPAFSSESEDREGVLNGAPHDPVVCGKRIACGDPRGERWAERRQTLAGYDREAVKLLKGTPFTCGARAGRCEGHNERSYTSMLQGTRKTGAEFGAARHIDGSTGFSRGGTSWPQTVIIPSWGKDPTYGTPRDLFIVHTHPSSGRFFSEMDASAAWNLQVPTYVTTIDGYLIRYDPISVTIKNLGYLNP